MNEDKEIEEFSKITKYATAMLLFLAVGVPILLTVIMLMSKGVN